MSKFLMVDDDIALTAGLAEAFVTRGLKLEVVHNGQDALQLLTAFDFDLILLDWSMPGMTGLEVCREYRRNKGTAYIIFLTGEAEAANKELALDAGGDDYITKPFDPREVFARIQSVMRRVPLAADASITAGGASLNPDNHILKFGTDKAVQLAPKESAILAHLMRNKNRPFNAQKLLDALWPSTADVSSDTVRTCVKRLRQKLSAVGHDDFLKSIAGAGYVVEE